jgi:hypothetical protein
MQMIKQTTTRICRLPCCSSVVSSPLFVPASQLLFPTVHLPHLLIEPGPFLLQFGQKFRVHVLPATLLPLQLYLLQSLHHLFLKHTQLVSETTHLTRYHFVELRLLLSHCSQFLHYSIAPFNQLRFGVLDFNRPHPYLPL